MTDEPLPPTSPNVPKRPNFGPGYKPGERQAVAELPEFVAKARASGRTSKVNKMGKVAILETASDLISGDRAEAYGSYRDQMIALSRAFNGITDKDITPEEAGIFLQLLKIRRSLSAKNQDNYVDLAGYAALQGEAFGSDK